MTRPVQIADAAPTATSTAAVNTRHDLGNGVIVVRPTPGQGGEGIARDVLGALGKRFRDRTLRAVLSGCRRSPRFGCAPK